jgi:hypothetical protein
MRRVVHFPTGGRVVARVQAVGVKAISRQRQRYSLLIYCHSSIINNDFNLALILHEQVAHKVKQRRHDDRKIRCRARKTKLCGPKSPGKMSHRESIPPLILQRNFLPLPVVFNVGMANRCRIAGFSPPKARGKAGRNCESIRKGRFWFSSRSTLVLKQLTRTTQESTIPTVLSFQ